MGIFGKISLKNAIKNKENPVKAVKAAGPIVPVKNTKKKKLYFRYPAEYRRKYGQKGVRAGLIKKKK